MIDWIFFGHSHLAALQRAWISLSNESDFSEHQAHFFIIDHKSIYEFFSMDDGKANLSEKLKKQFHDIIGASKHFEMVLSLAGNDHSIIGLTNAEQDYLIAHPNNEESQSNLNKENNPQILSRDMLREVFEERLMGVKALIPQIIESFKTKPYLLESPPPLADAQRILNFPGAFAQLLEESGVNNSQNRLSLWKIQNQVMYQYADDNQILFVNNPDGIFNKDGFLSEDFAGNDPTHGNQAYGVEVLKQLNSLLGMQQKTKEPCCNENHHVKR